MLKRIYEIKSCNVLFPASSQKLPTKKIIFANNGLLVEADKGDLNNLVYYFNRDGKAVIEGLEYDELIDQRHYGVVWFTTPETRQWSKLNW